MEIKATKTKNGIELSGPLPPVLANSSSLEVFPLRDGIYLLAIKGAVGKATAVETAKPEGRMTEKEKNVVRKLISIRFEQRVPSVVDKMLSKDEKEILGILAKKRLVWIFFGDKYGKEGVYNISDSAFAEVRDRLVDASSDLSSQRQVPHLRFGASRTSGPLEQRLESEQQPVQEMARAPHGTERPELPLPINSPAHLEKLGWMVLDNENEARNFGQAFSDKAKSGLVRGLRAFDRKYYFIAKGFAEEKEVKVMAALEKGDKTAQELSSEIGVAPEGCRALLIHLAEAGEVLEKQKGKYSKA